jgi:hypothetical protein
MASDSLSLAVHNVHNASENVYDLTIHLFSEFHIVIGG